VHPPVTVLIATRDRPESLGRCLESIVAMRYPELAVVVVDSASRTVDARGVVERFSRRLPITFVEEQRPGLARAHNAGLRAVTTPIVAITDDDVIVDPGWVASIVDAFAVSPKVGCVTGRIVAARLDTPAQRWVDDRLGFSKGSERRVFDLAGNRPADPLFPYAAGALGSGANMSFRLDALRAIGGFDPALGAGTPARGGDDLAAFHAVIRRGYTLVYEPAAVVQHHHYERIDALERQIRGYGVGLGAYLAKLVIEDPRVAVDMARRTAPALRRLRSMRASGTPATATPPRAIPVVGRKPASSTIERRLERLASRERRAVLLGPVAYGRSLAQAGTDGAFPARDRRDPRERRGWR
jgi:cellulose synthase/poly-beta-1,6-N-acetylglucosamine synthase-like glycosyltransferase